MTRRAYPLWTSVRWVLWAEWDPIGCGVPEDEYDAYVPAVVHKIIAQEGAESIAAYLDWVTNERMSCPQPDGHNLKIARKLADLQEAE
jgi:hypothetical protein